MTAENQSKADIRPVIKITLVNYDPVMHDAYSKNFMSPLIKGLLKFTRYPPKRKLI
jgi:hypothetical protein